MTTNISPFRGTLSPVQKLDFVLSQLKKETVSIEDFPQIYKDKEILFTEWSRILEKLRKDGYIYMNEHTRWNVTFEGYLFHGYQKQQKLEELTFARDDQISNQRASYERRLLWGTWWAGIAAFLVFLWYVWIWFYPSYSAFLK